MSEAFKERFTARRSEAGLSQDDIAKKLGLTSSAVSTWETGKRAPSLKVLVRLTDLLGCSAEWLLGLDDRTTDVPPWAATLVTDLAAITGDTDRLTVTNIVRSLALKYRNQAEGKDGGKA
jgi:transcriptional regulator with XRE-family HTH domain